MNADWINSIKNSLSLVKNVHDFLSFVRENWEKLPKSKFNSEEVVIFRCMEQYDGAGATTLTLAMASQRMVTLCIAIRLGVLVTAMLLLIPVDLFRLRRI